MVHYITPSSPPPRAQSNFPESFQCYKPSSHKVFGTICMTPNNTILLVKGRSSGKWSFPKGHKEGSETYLSCALRETMEETGINLSFTVPVACHKLSVGEYFFFEVPAEIPPIIHDAREIEEARWVPFQDIASLSCNVDVNNFLNRLKRQSRRYWV